MSRPAITPNLWKLKKRKKTQTQQSVDPEIQALLNQIDLGNQNGPSTNSSGVAPSSTGVLGGVIPNR